MQFPLSWSAWKFLVFSKSGHFYIMRERWSFKILTEEKHQVMLIIAPLICGSCLSLVYFPNSLTYNLFFVATRFIPDIDLWLFYNDEQFGMFRKTFLTSSNNRICCYYVCILFNLIPHSKIPRQAHIFFHTTWGAFKFESMQDWVKAPYFLLPKSSS